MCDCTSFLYFDTFVLTRGSKSFGVFTFDSLTLDCCFHVDVSEFMFPSIIFVLALTICSKVGGHKPVFEEFPVKVK